jgi:hypothetical protein
MTHFIKSSDDKRNGPFGLTPKVIELVGVFSWNLIVDAH